MQHYLILGLILAAPSLLYSFGWMEVMEALLFNNFLVGIMLVGIFLKED